uniref:tRNA/rRNA methyltransferase SpoU type domain-containing protein n=1 Tax=Serinus canaria TaxID=9135 RepID=A0A8C9UEB1_SERCA
MGKTRISFQMSKASAGAMEVFDVYSTDDLQGFLKRAEGWEVVGTASRPEDVEGVPVISCSEFRWDKPLIVVIGSEGEGLSLESQLQCQQMLAIPPGRALHPGLDSLNVSVAAGILLHSICSQKRRDLRDLLIPPPTVPGCSSLALGTARDPGAATAALGTCARLTTLPGEDFFPISHLNGSY